MTTSKEIDNIVAADLEEDNKVKELKKVRVTSLDKSSMLLTRCCPNCSAKITNTDSKLVTCDNSDTVSLKSDCEWQMMVR